MPHKHMSAVENTSINTNTNTNTMEGNTLTTPRHVHKVLEMPRRTLRRLLARGHVNVGLEKLLAQNGVLDTEGSVIVVMDDPRDPPEPPLPPSLGPIIYQMNLGAMGQVDVRTLHHADVAELERANLLVVEAAVLGSGLAQADQRLVVVLRELGGGVAQARVGGSRTGRRFDTHWDTRASFTRGLGTLVARSDGFDYPPDVG